MKWVINRTQKVWYSKDVIDRIKEYVNAVITVRPHSDNKVLENILKIIEEADGNADTKNL